MEKGGGGVAARGREAWGRESEHRTPNNDGGVGCGKSAKLFAKFDRYWNTGRTMKPDFEQRSNSNPRHKM